MEESASRQRNEDRIGFHKKNIEMWILSNCLKGKVQLNEKGSKSS